MPHILVVDDEELVRNMARFSLQRYGYTVETAPDGPNAVQVFTARAQQFDAVLLDLTMPMMNGEDVLGVLGRFAPADAGYAHLEGNSDSHAKAIAAGCSQLVPVESGRPALGRWQRIFFCEFDGPRHRQVWVTPLRG